MIIWPIKAVRRNALFSFDGLAFVSISTSRDIIAAAAVVVVFEAHDRFVPDAHESPRREGSLIKSDEERSRVAWPAADVVTGLIRSSELCH